MKRIFSALTLVAACFVLAACASPRTASFTNGSVTNLSSAEATTLGKQVIRKDKVKAVMDDHKPIVRFEAHDGQPITINAKVFEVNVPLDVRELLAEQASETSENVQLFREVRGIGKDVVVPLGVAGLLVSDRKNSSNNAARIEEARSAERIEQTRTMGELADTGMSYASKEPLVLTTPAPTIVRVPVGSSYLGAAPAPAATAE
jgi:predicted small secreted protein